MGSNEFKKEELKTLNEYSSLQPKYTIDWYLCKSSSLQCLGGIEEYLLDLSCHYILIWWSHFWQDTHHVKWCRVVIINKKYY